MNADLFQQLFDASPNAYMVLDRELRYVTANRTYLRLTASTLESLVGRRITDAFPHDPDDPNNEPARLLRQSFQRVLSTGKVDQLAMIVYRVPEHTAEGISTTERAWSATHTPIFSDDGTVTHILQHAVDVTPLWQARDRSEDRSQAAGIMRRAEGVQAQYHALEAQHTMLRQLFEQAPVFTAFLRGPDHVVVLANEAYMKLVGHRSVLGLAVATALPEVVDQGFITLLDGVRSSAKPFVGREVRIMFQHTPGAASVERYVDFVYQPIVDDNGEVDGVFVVGTDVTDRKLANAERERLAAIVEQCEDFIGAADLEGNLTFMNEAGLALLGLSPEQMATAPATEVFLPSELPRVMTTITEALATTGRWRGELHMRNFATGEAIPVDYNVFTLRTAGSDAVSGYASVTRDLRARRALEQERLFLADAIPSQVWTADTSGGLTYVNRQVVEYFGRNEQQMLRDGWQGVVHEDDLPKVIDRWTRCLSSGDDYEVEFRLLRAVDGSWRWHMGRARAMKDGNGRPLKWYGTNVDIDDKRRTDSERDALIGKLERSNKELDRFAYVASHDLKTPLRGIGNLAQWIEDDLGDTLTVDSKKHLELLRDRVGRMDALINGVLRYSRTSSPDEHVQQVDVRDLMDVVVDLLSPPCEVSITLGEQLPVLQTAYVPLQQVLLNLVSNAIKHAGRPDVHVHVSVSAEIDAFYRFTVADNGRGVPVEHRERVWSLFQTLGEPGHGDGIGLSVVKRAVELQGGVVRLRESELGGAAFEFTWPKNTERQRSPSGPQSMVK